MAQIVRRFLLSPYVLMLVPPLAWAGNAVVGRGVVGDVAPVALAFWRWVLALAILAPFGWPRLAGHGALLRRRWRTVAALSVSSITVYNTCLYMALQTTTAINATLVSAAIPVAIVVLAWVWLGETLRPRQGVGVVASLAGVVLVIARGDVAALARLEPNGGDLWVLAAVASWAVYSVVLKKHPLGIDPVAQLTVQVAVGLVVLTPFYLWELAAVGHPRLTPHAVAAVAYVAVFPSVAAYYFWNQGVAALGASVAGQYTYLIPVFTALLAVASLGETLRWFHVAGLGLIVAGIWLATAVRRPSAGG